MPPSLTVPPTGSAARRDLCKHQVALAGGNPIQSARTLKLQSVFTRGNNWVGKRRARRPTALDRDGAGALPGSQTATGDGLDHTTDDTVGCSPTSGPGPGEANAGGITMTRLYDTRFFAFFTRPITHNNGSYLGQFLSFRIGARLGPRVTFDLYLVR